MPKGDASKIISLPPTITDDPGFIAPGRSSTLSSISLRADALGDSCLTTSHPGRPSTTILEPGDRMEPGKRCTPLYASGCGYVSRGTLSPAPGIVDSQPVKTTGVGGEERGYDGGKKIKGRKRHLLVDTQGLVLKAKVHSAKVMDRDGLEPLFSCTEARFPRLKHLWC
jgi:hypothetical protein